MSAAIHRSLRARAAARYQPERVELLLVAEAPPAATDRYFYYPEVSTQDSLFRYIARGVLGIEPTRTNKAQLLAFLQARGVLLIDLCEDPVTRGMDLSACVEDLAGRASDLAPDHIILIKASVFDNAFEAMRAAGLPVVDERIPFPGSGQQRKFEEAFRRALVSIQWRRGPA